MPRNKSRQGSERTERSRIRKGEGAMRSSLRRATVIMILLAVFLAPGFLQARTPAWERASVSRPAVEDGFFSMVWTLLTGFYEHGVGAGLGSSGYKNGGQMDPSGTPTSTTTPETSTDGDNGGQMDPSGTP